MNVFAASFIQYSTCQIVSIQMILVLKLSAHDTFAPRALHSPHIPIASHRIASHRNTPLSPCMKQYMLVIHMVGASVAVRAFVIIFMPRVSFEPAFVFSYADRCGWLKNRSTKFLS